MRFIELSSPQETPVFIKADEVYAILQLGDATCVDTPHGNFVVTELPDEVMAQLRDPGSDARYAELAAACVELIQGNKLMPSAAATLQNILVKHGAMG